MIRSGKEYCRRGEVEGHKRGHQYYVSIDYGTVNPFAVGIFDFDGRSSTMIKGLHYSGRDRDRLDNEGYYSKLKTLIGDLPIEYTLLTVCCRIY